MSDTSLNEIQPKLLKLDTPDQDPALSKKQDSLFIVPSPQSTTSNLTTVTLNDPRKPSPQNKVHVIPYNLTSQKTTPIKLIKDLKPASQSTISSSIGSKKLIQVNAFSSSANTGSNLATSPIRANNLFINSSDKSPKSNTKILTISNGLNSGSSLPNSNKIQYVKIVNTPNVSSNSAPFKITTITSSHNANSNNSQEGFSIRPFSSIASNSIKTIQKPPSVNTSPISSQTSTVSLKQSDQPSSSVLLDAINNSPNLHDSSSNKTPPTTTIQLVNQSQTQAQRGQMISPKTSIIQRIQSFPPNQSIGKNVATTNNASQSNQPDRSVSYKVLNQQFQTNLSKNNGSNGSEANSKSVINSENLNLLSNTINQCNTSGQSKSPEIDNLKISTSKPKAANQQTSPVSLNQSSSSGSTRKPCNCTKSMCLKLYCDCFAQGSFCVDCNCVNCFNTLDHEEERNKAIKMVLERNPQAFQSKISKFTASLTMSKAMPAQISQAPAPTSGIEDLISASVTTDELDEIQSRHVKGCNCKKSNCLKRYCECFLAKIQCSSLCKCVGCKNCDESTRTLLQLANAADLRKQQHQQEQKQQLIQQQQHSKQFFSPKGSQAGLSGSIKQSTGFKTRNLENSNENKHILMEQQQQLISRAYKSALNKSILKETCERLISIVLSEIENAEMKTDDSQDGLSEPMEIDMEKCLIEHLGSCLAEIIHSAETQSPSN